MNHPKTLGRYEVNRVIGKGAMGIVYEGRDPLIGRPVAIKVIRGDVDPSTELESRFQREFQSAGRLSHANIVPVYDVGREGRAWYIAMELVDGRGLDALLATAAPDHATSLSILAAIAQGLDHAHAQGVVHRDIKPANVLVGNDGVVKVTDFGVARIAGATVTVAGSLLGTPAFMSPEQGRGLKVTPASDQFSLAVMAYELLTGERPFDGDTPSAILYRIVHEEPSAPTVVAPGLAQSVTHALMRAMSKRPDRRFPSCSEFVDTLANALDERNTSPAQPRHSASAATESPIRVAVALAATVVVAIAAIWIANAWNDPVSSAGDPTATAVAPRDEAPPPAPPDQFSTAGADAAPTNGAAAPAEAVATEDSGRPDGATSEAVDEPDTAVAVTDASQTPPDPGPEPAAEARAVQGTPFLFESSPAGALVVVDGSEIGRTPVPYPVLAGIRHRVSLSLPGHQPVNWAFSPESLTPEQVADRRLFFALEPVTPPGTVMVNGTYDFEVEASANGRRTRRSRHTTGAAIDLPPGSWTIRVLAPEVFLDHTLRVDLRSGETAEIPLPSLLSVRVAAAPGNCRVNVNGIDVGVTPLELPIVAGQHEFLFEWPGLGKSIRRNERLTSLNRNIFATAPAR